MDRHKHHKAYCVLDWRANYMSETIWASVKNEGCKRDGFLGSLRKGQQIRWEITDTPTPQKEIILSTRTWIYYKYVKQQENRLEVGATTKMLVEVVERRTLDKILQRRQPLWLWLLNQAECPVLYILP